MNASDECFTNVLTDRKFLTKISNTEYHLSRCLELPIIHKNLLLEVNFCERMLPGYKTENDNSPQKAKYQIL